MRNYRLADEDRKLTNIDLQLYLANGITRSAHPNS